MQLQGQFQSTERPSAHWLKPCSHQLHSLALDRELRFLKALAMHQQHGIGQAGQPAGRIDLVDLPEHLAQMTEHSVQPAGFRARHVAADGVENTEAAMKTVTGQNRMSVSELRHTMHLPLRRRQTYRPTIFERPWF